KTQRLNSFVDSTIGSRSKIIWGSGHGRGLTRKVQCGKISVALMNLWWLSHETLGPDKCSFIRLV
ncbi:MAG: hypothetical protein QW186_09555, partial [Candidatus Bathyarchaeia archaeon]